VQLFSIVHECVNNVIKHAYDTPTLCIRYRENADNLMLLVQDFGDGFDLEKVENQATLGLSGIKTRCEMMGATLNITSKALEGTKVKVTIPIEKIKNYRDKNLTEETLSEEKEKPSFSENKDPKKILIVDNQVEYGESLCQILSKNTDAILVFKESVAEAKAFLKENNYDIDVLITDITMPDESGIQLVKHLKDGGHDKNIKIILHTINDNPSYIFQATNRFNIKFYIWKEQARTEQHPILTALDNLDSEFYSPEIGVIKDSFILKEYDAKEDKKYRNLFGIYVKYLKEETSKEKAFEKTNIEYVEKYKRSYGEDTFFKYVQRHKNNLGIMDELEMQRIIIRLSTDFGFLQ
jgi:DNA-binding NarL/FixJ family response regulator